jgi:phage shock protein PspC (stress-responsive transcriptional regulator)
MDGLVRPRYSRKIAGVCAAFAMRYGWDLTALRVIAVVLAVMTFPCAVIVYLILWVVLPEEPLYLPATASQGQPVNNAS